MAHLEAHRATQIASGKLFVGSAAFDRPERHHTSVIARVPQLDSDRLVEDQPARLEQVHR